MTSRYNRAKIFGINYRFGTSFAIPALRNNIKNGNIRIVEEFSLKESDRLDIIAGKKWGDGRLWWIIAICSEIGWSPQVPPGTFIRIPNLQDCLRYIG
jgi:hypothetical protein